MAKLSDAAPRAAQADGPESPRLAGIHHIGVPVRDLDQACEFWTRVFGAEPLPGSRPGFAELRVANISVQLAQREAGWTGWEAEYPHRGFLFAPSDVWAWQERLHAFGVPTGRVWTRRGEEGLMYFRDPTGNLFELACWHGLKDANELPVGLRAGGDFTNDFAALNYDWHPPAELSASVKPVRPVQFDHLSLPVRNNAQTSRFWIEVLGAQPGREPNHMVDIAGIAISFNEGQGSGWTAWDAEFPHYAFAIEPEHLLSMRARLETFGIPTHPISIDASGAAMMYFRDPAGNLFQLHSARGLPDPDQCPAGTVASDHYAVDFAALNYVWSH